jgi:hypothetical protein
MWFIFNQLKAFIAKVAFPQEELLPVGGSMSLCPRPSTALSDSLL